MVFRNFWGEYRETDPNFQVAKITLLHFFFSLFFDFQRLTYREPMYTSTEFIIRSFQVGIYLLKVNNGNTRTMCKICSKLTIKTSE